VEPGLEAVHVDVNHWGSEERKHLAEDEAANNGDAQGPAKFGAGASTDGER
jgi:hypothetical protein